MTDHLARCAPPNGSADAPYFAQATSEWTPLQSHVAFFDRDGDGVIWPKDTLIGFRALGFNRLVCALAVIIVHAGMSYVTWGSLLPDPYFRVRIAGIHRAKHGSDSNVYTRKGLFNEDNFEDIFASYSSPPSYDTLTLAQAIALSRGNRDPFDFFGWFANLLEWSVTYLLIWPNSGKMAKSDIKALYDGSLFWTIGRRNADAFRRNGKSRVQ